MRGGHEEGHAEGYICSHRASGLDRHTNAQDQHNMICHESLDKAVSYRPYPDRFFDILGSRSSHPNRIRSRLAGIIRRKLDVVISVIIIVITATRAFPEASAVDGLLRMTVLLTCLD